MAHRHSVIDIIAGDLRSALSRVEKACDRLESDALLPDFTLLRGMLGETLGMDAYAATAYREVGGLAERTLKTSLLRLAEFLLDRRPPDARDAILRGLPGFAPSGLWRGTAAYLVGLILRRRGRKAAAADMFRRVPDMDPLNNWPSILSRRVPDRRAVRRASLDAHRQGD